MRKESTKKVRKLTKSGGNSYYITLPVEAIREFDWQKKQKLEVEIDKKRKRLIIKDWEK